MSAETGHIGASLGAIAAGTAILGAAMAGLGAPWWAWTGFALWGLLWLTAASGLSDPASRKFLAGTLRKSTFTQIYTTLARRNVMWLWNRYCDPAPNDAKTPYLFRAALTWRLYDPALTLAMVYPAVLLIGQWVVTGAEGQVGRFVVLPEADFWPDRAIVILIALILMCAVVVVTSAASGKLSAVTKVSAWMMQIAITAALAFAIALAFVYAGAVAGVVAVAIAFRFAGTVAVAVAVASAFTGLTSVAVAVAVAVAVVVAIACAFAFDALDKRYKPRLALGLLTGAMIGAVLATATTLDWVEVPEERRSLFLFLAVLPLINALFDVVSYAVTLTLIRRGLRSALPFLWGVADLAVACVLLLGLGATLVAVIHGLNLLAGVPFLDLRALFAGLRADPAAYIWLYLMLFSTLLPTLLHACLSLLGVQGIWPLKPRRRVAGWVEGAAQSPLHAIRASLGLSLVWAVPLLGLCAVLYALWHVAAPALMTGLGIYLDWLSWIAGGTIGAF